MIKLEVLSAALMATAMLTTPVLPNRAMRGTSRHAPMIAPRTARVTSTDAFVSPLRASAHSRRSLGIRLPRASPRPAIDPSAPADRKRLGWKRNSISPASSVAFHALSSSCPRVRDDLNPSWNSSPHVFATRRRQRCARSCTCRPRSPDGTRVRVD